MMTHTTDTYDALVALARSLRPRWDVPGIRAAIRAAMQRQPQPTLAELAYALVRVAENPTIVTPGIVALDGQHWGKSTKDPEEPERNRMCVVCGQFHKPTDPCTGPVVITRSTADHIAAARLALGKRVEYVKAEARATDDVPLPREDET
jgi:hypothetical protein